MLKKSFASILNNLGRLTALITATVTVLVTFTDIAFSTLSFEKIASSLLVLLTSSYIIYFSLEDAGERLGEKTEEYLGARERYNKAREKICGEDVERLRIFCQKYAERELEFRRENTLLSLGISRESVEKYEREGAGRCPASKAAKKLKRLKSVSINPKILLSWDKTGDKSELENPEKKKIAHLLIKMIPTTLCMLVTVSVMLNVKSDMTVSDVLNSLLKLLALPIAGFRGYAEGYNFTRRSRALWLETKASILEAFLKDG